MHSKWLPILVAVSLFLFWVSIFTRLVMLLTLCLCSFFFGHRDCWPRPDYFHIFCLTCPSSCVLDLLHTHNDHLPVISPLERNDYAKPPFTHVRCCFLNAWPGKKKRARNVHTLCLLHEVIFPFLCVWTNFVQQMLFGKDFLEVKKPFPFLW